MSVASVAGTHERDPWPRRNHALYSPDVEIVELLEGSSREVNVPAAGGASGAGIDDTDVDALGLVGPADLEHGTAGGFAGPLLDQNDRQTRSCRTG